MAKIPCLCGIDVAGDNLVSCKSEFHFARVNSTLWD